MTAEAQAQARWTFSIFMIVLATSIPFVVEAVDPTLLSLNMPTIQHDLGIPSDLVGFTGSIATLVMADLGRARAPRQERDKDTLE
jgi:hypothetical protein